MKQDIEVASRIEREKVTQELHEFAVPLFKAGAEWRINSVWHSITVIPNCHRFIVFLPKKSTIGSKNPIMGILEENRTFISSRPGCILCRLDEMESWAYLDDLLPWVIIYSILKVRIMKKDLTDKEKEERMNYLTIHKCKNEDERKELKELCDWYFKDTPTLTMSFSLTEEDFRVTMERDVELSEVARAVKNQHHKKKI